MPTFPELGLTINMILFAVAAAIVWIAGTRIARYADAISAKTGLGHAFIGLLLLGGVTSLPELAVSVSAAASGNAALAVNNILGGVAMQVAILAIADFVIGRRALTSVVPDSAVLLQGGLNVVLLSIVAAGIVVGDHSILGIGAWSWLILLITIYSLALLASTSDREPWLANIEETEDQVASADRGEPSDNPIRLRDEPLGRIVGMCAGAGVAIIAAGYVVSSSAEVIAEQTGLGSSFVGAVLVAISTSLPELSTVLSAVRLGLYTMAISDILGTNLFDVGLLFVVDAAAPGEAVLNRVGNFSVFGSVLGILVTSLFVVGLAERRDRTILRMGVDSAAVLVCYVGGLVLLYGLRGST